MNTTIFSRLVRVLGGAALAIAVSSASASAGPAQFIIVNLNAPGVGFNDPTPAAPVGGNTGTTLGEQRLIAFQHAASIWSARLDSNVPIRIRAQFTSLGAGVLGSAGPVNAFVNFPNAPKPNVIYYVALANKLAGVDLAPGQDDINANFSTNFNFYLGLDNNHGPLNDLVTVLLHEFAHGLGFSQQANLTTGALLAGFPDQYNELPLRQRARQVLAADDQRRAGRVGDPLGQGRARRAVHQRRRAERALLRQPGGGRQPAQLACRHVPVRHRRLRAGDWQPQRHRPGDRRRRCR